MKLKIKADRKNFKLFQYFCSLFLIYFLSYCFLLYHKVHFSNNIKVLERMNKKRNTIGIEYHEHFRSKILELMIKV